MKFFTWYEYIGGQFSSEKIFATPIRVMNNYVGLVYSGRDWIVSSNIGGNLDHNWVSINEPKNIPNDVKKKLFKTIFTASSDD